VSAPGERPRPSWSEIKRDLEAAGFRPSKSLGQNFLVDDNLLRAIVRDAEVAPGERVVEIGPGCGVLTLALVAAGARVIAVEIDSRLLAVARSVLGPSPASGGGDVTWIEGDALAGKHALSPRLLEHLPQSSDWKLVSNLPYSAGTPILASCSRLEHPPRSATVLLQRDLAERIAAGPGGKERGAVSVRIQACYEVKIVRTVPPQLFWPRPKVDSALLRLDLRADRPRGDDLARFDSLVGHVFEQRRKTVLNRLQSWFGDRAVAERACEACGVHPRSRPEELTLAQWSALSRRESGDAGTA
jgi:16S rRNA (adenine1518-N6/adenine1519-N6)-dimethyltransferase